MTPTSVLVFEPGRRDPVGTMTWQRALLLAIFTDEVRAAAGRGELIYRIDEEGRSLPCIEVLAFQGEDGDPVIIRSGGGVEHLVPAVVCLTTPRVKGRRFAKYSFENVYARDRGICQYCLRHVPFGVATRDHVVPRARGGIANWQNIVLACAPCNRRKADRTPDEAGMPLRRQPTVPAPFALGFATGRRIPIEWERFLRPGG